MTKLKRRSRNSYRTDLLQLARGAYAKHRIVWRAEGDIASFIIRHPEHSFYYTEIVFPRVPSVLVHGDVDTVRFESYSSNKSKWLAKLCWVAESNLDYIATKTFRGSCRGHTVFDKDIAISGIYDEIRMHARAGEFKTARKYVKFLREFKDISYEFTEEEFHSEFYALFDDCDFPSYGRVIKPAIYYAQEACKTLLRLLPKEQEKGPGIASLNL